jgi:hypothetical protein
MLSLKLIPLGLQCLKSAPLSKKVARIMHTGRLAFTLLIYLTTLMFDLRSTNSVMTGLWCTSIIGLKLIGKQYYIDTLLQDWCY